MTRTDDLRLDRRQHARPGGGGTVRPTGRAASEERFTVTVDRRSRRPVVLVEGELDASAASLLQAVIEHVVEQGTPGPVLVDLDAVRFADTHGLAPVLDGGAEIRTASRAVRRVLRLLGVPAPTPPGPDPSP